MCRWRRPRFLFGKPWQPYRALQRHYDGMLVEPVVVYEYSLCKSELRRSSRTTTSPSSSTPSVSAASRARFTAMSPVIPPIPTHRHEHFVFAPRLNRLSLAFDAALPPFTAMDFVWLWYVLKGLLFPFSSNCILVLSVYASPYSSVSCLSSLVESCAPSSPVCSILVTLRFEDFDGLS